MIMGKIFDEIYEQLYPYVQSALERKVVDDHAPIEYTDQDKREFIDNFTENIDEGCPFDERDLKEIAENYWDCVVDGVFDIKIPQGHEFSELELKKNTMVILSCWADLMYLSTKVWGDTQLGDDLQPLEYKGKKGNVLKDSGERALAYTLLSEDEVKGVLKEWGEEYIKD